MSLNDECKYDVSDDDCYKCMKHGIIFSCPVGCKEFEETLLESTLKIFGEAMKEK